VSEVELSESPPAGGYSVTLPTFEGPLDLLLHLCQKHELDILDIPIAFVTEKYLEYLAVMQLINLDVASEYLVMAATLAHIKSKMLLPAPPPGQEDELAGEEEDPREALIRRLLEYQKYKQAGEDLAGRGVAGRDVFMRGMPIEEAVHTGLPPLAQVPLFSLVEAFQTVLSKSQVKLSHDIVHERVTLADRINELVDILRVKRRVTFEELFADVQTRFDLVITFLALLEMTRLRMTRLFQTDFDSPIFVEFTAQVAADDDNEAGAAAASENGETESAEAGEFSGDDAAGENLAAQDLSDEDPASDVATASDAAYASEFPSDGDLAEANDVPAASDFADASDLPPAGDLAEGDAAAVTHGAHASDAVDAGPSAVEDVRQVPNDTSEASNRSGRSPALRDGVQGGRRTASEGWHGVNEASDIANASEVTAEPSDIADASEVTTEPSDIANAGDVNNVDEKSQLEASAGANETAEAPTRSGDENT
jgi:segregation and condensation protein A